MTYLDALIQLNTFSRNYEGLIVPKLIKSLTINTELHAKAVEAEGSEHKAEFYKFYGITR